MFYCLWKAIKTFVILSPLKVKKKGKEKYEPQKMQQELKGHAPMIYGIDIPKLLLQNETFCVQHFSHDLHQLF